MPAASPPMIARRMGATVYPLTTMPELPEVEITARRLDEALRGQVIESVRTPGINVLKTFDPPLQSIEGHAITGIGRRGKQFTITVDNGLVVLVHLMSAGRLQLFDKRASMKDRSSRFLVRLSRGPGAAPARVRDQAGGLGEAPASRRARVRGGHRDARARGVARPAGGLRRAPAAGRGAAPARRAARSARHRRHRPLVGGRDPVDGDALAVQARRRPRRRRGGPRCARRPSRSWATRSRCTRRR